MKTKPQAGRACRKCGERPGFCKCERAPTPDATGKVLLTKEQWEEAQRDKSRVDKLEAMLENENDLDVCKRHDGYHVSQIFEQHRDGPPLPTLRAAIDAASADTK